MICKYWEHPYFYCTNEPLPMIKFSKYHGTGNDFIMIDNRPLMAKLSQAEIAHLCHRRFGIGADGLILLQNHSELHFEMIYYNSDGNPSSMCGNGGRCIAAFAAQIGIEANNGPLRFMAIDGVHEANLEEPVKNGYRVNLKMQDVKEVIVRDSYCVLNTGSPHFVIKVNDVDTMDIISKAHAIRYSDQFKEKGINVNFIQQADKDLKVRTYERGVEDETWSCGTGVVASAIASYLFTGNIPAQIHTKGGLLQVNFATENKQEFTDIHLIGPAVKVFEGFY
jgi:diaminopimelate epimerase